MSRKLQWRLLVFVLLLLNALVLLNRNNGFKYEPYKTYNSLYATDSTLCLTDIHFEPNKLQLKFSLPINGQWKLYTDNADTLSLAANNNQLGFPILQGLHTYKLIAPNNAPPVTVTAEHTPHESGDDNEFIYSSIPGPGVQPVALDVWRITSRAFPADEVKQGEKLLHDSIHISGSDDDVQKIMKIGLYLRHLPNNKAGIDPGKVARMSVWQQIKLGQECKANYNCGNYAAMFYFLGALAGLVTRGIIYSGPDGNWHYASHYMNEVYLRKQQQWAVVDNLNNIYLPHDSSRFYNAVDIKKMTEVNGFAHKQCYDLNGDTARLTDYEVMGQLHKHYNSSEADIRFLHGTTYYGDSWWSKLLQFYIPLRDYELYSDKKMNDYARLALKTLLILGFLFSLPMYVAWELGSRRKQRAADLNTSE